MIGAGIFSAASPAAQAAGSGLLLALAIAAVLAYLNATSVAQLAALYPESGGTYVYGRARLGPFWGYLAGIAFVIGKLASCSAMALTFAHHALPQHASLVSVLATVCLTAVNLRGVHKTAAMTRVIVFFVLASLAIAVFAALAGQSADFAHVGGLFSAGVYDTLQAAGLLFFAFAGYARIATLGEEVIDPARTIPRAIPIALAVALGVYAVVMFTALACLGPEGLARTATPLAAAAEAGRFGWAASVVRVGATVASLGVLLSLLAGVGRTVFAMASHRDLPSFFSAVHPRFKVPHRAELAVGIVVACVTAVVDVRTAMGFSSFAVLVYYAIANASAFTLRPPERRKPRWLAGLGVVGCLMVALTLPLRAVLTGSVLMFVACMAWLAFRVTNRCASRD